MSNKYTSVLATQKNSGRNVQVETRLCIWGCDYWLLVVMSRAAWFLNAWLHMFPQMSKGHTPGTCTVFTVICGPGSLDFWARLDCNLRCFLGPAAHLFQPSLVLSFRKRSSCLWPYQFLWRNEIKEIPTRSNPKNVSQFQKLREHGLQPCYVPDGVWASWGPSLRT